MGQLGRMLAYGVMTVGNVVLALIYVRVVLPMVEISKDFQGPFTSSIDTVGVIMPVVIGGLQLGLTLWLFSGGIQNERAREVRV